MLRDVKESYKTISLKKAGDVERSKFKETKDPHLEVLDKLMNRPFLKHKVMESRSVKNFISDLFQDGFQEDMIIFESGFVRKYPKFSADFVDLYFKSNTTHHAGRHDLDFLETYDRIVQPKRWQKSYKKIKESYTQQSNEQIFNNPKHQIELFKDPNQKKPYEVFKCKAPYHLQQRNLIIQSIRHKIQQQLLLKSDEYIKQRLELYNKRKEQRISKELSLPTLSIEEKKSIVIEDLKQKKQLQRVYSQEAFQELMKEEQLQRRKSQIEGFDDGEGEQAGNGDYHRRYNSLKKDFEVNTKGDHSNIESRNHFLKYNNSSKMSQLPSIQRSKYSSMSIDFDQSKSNNIDKNKKNKMEYSTEVKNHMQISTLIYSLKIIVSKLIRERQQKNPDPAKIQEQIDLAHIFLDKLVNLEECVPAQYEQIQDVVDRIQKMIEQSQSSIESLDNSSQEKTQTKFNDPNIKMLKANFLNKLAFLEFNKNQLRNTSFKYLKFYQKSEKQQKMDHVKFLQTSNVLQLPPVIKESQLVESSIQKSTLESTAIGNNLRDQTTINISGFQNPDQTLKMNELTQSSIDQNQSYRNANQKIVSQLEQLINIQEVDSAQRSKPSSRLGKKQSGAFLRSSANLNHLQTSYSIAQKQKLPSSIEKLIKVKDFKEVNEKLDIQKAIEECISEFKPYHYYDEVIKDYFGGQIDFTTLEKTSKDNKEYEDLKIEIDMLDSNSEILSTDNQKQNQQLRETLVQQTINDMIILAKEEGMTHLKAIKSIENHVRNEKKLTFKQKQEKSTLLDYLNQLPDKPLHPDSDEEQQKLIEKAKQEKTQQLKDAQEFRESVSRAIKRKYQDEKKKQVGFDMLMYVQDLKIYHNEFDIPMLVDQYTKKFQTADNDILEFQKKNMVFYRKQLDQIELKLIKLIQQFN